MIEKDIAKAKAALIQKAKKKGIYENFGQREVNKLMDKCRAMNCNNTERSEVMAKINAFDSWCMNFDQRKLDEVK